MNKLQSIILEPYRLFKKIRLFMERLLSFFPAFYFFKATKNDEYPISLSIWFKQKVLGNNSGAYWPMHPSSLVSYANKILIGKGVVPGYNPGCYLHGVNGIFIGDYTFIAPNVGIMIGNHDLYDLRNQTTTSPVKIGKYCWLGMNAVILPGVVLGDFTIVGAGAIVTHSFEEGYCVIGGNPARVLRKLEKENCVRYEMGYSYIGYVPAEKFDYFRKLKLNI
jgi:acetyltransferase-like isoleucine patch superfamily enzyme